MVPASVALPELPVDVVDELEPDDPQPAAISAQQARKAATRGSIQSELLDTRRAVAPRHLYRVNERVRDVRPPLGASGSMSHQRASVRTNWRPPALIAASWDGHSSVGS
jgi:hypothetical protein